MVQSPSVHVQKIQYDGGKTGLEDLAFEGMEERETHVDGKGKATCKLSSWEGVQRGTGEKNSAT